MTVPFIAPLLSLFLLLILGVSVVSLLLASLIWFLAGGNIVKKVEDIDSMPNGNLSAGKAALFTILIMIIISVMFSVGSSILNFWTV